VNKIHSNYSVIFNTICNGETVSLLEIEIQTFWTENTVRLSKIPLLN